MGMPHIERDLKALAARVEQIAAAKALRTMADPVEWTHRLSTVNYELDAWQQDYLRSTAKREILLCSRQVGKSSTSALKAAHIVRGGGLCFCLAPTQRQAALLFRQISDHLVADNAAFTRITQTELELKNGGHAISLGTDRPSGIRGHTLVHPGDAVMLLDEAAFCRDEVWPVIMPFLASAPRARLVLLSTPCGPSGEFHRVWTEGGDDWNRVRVPATECSRISPEFLAQEEMRLGPDLYAQEFMCEFVQPAGAFFSSDLVKSMFDGNSETALAAMFAAE